ncbi:MAG: GTPase Era [Gammaproteobacteria bacterium]|nr:GTPase Era [Gammaproteobacteria bacterium]
MTEPEYRAGIVAVIGRPNTGKSTLVNALVEEKISIVTSKPQTTRHSIMGILTAPETQIVFVDTPGLHGGSTRLINRAMNRSATSSMAGADFALFVTESTGWKAGDELALERLKESGIPALLVINKLDLLKRRQDLLPVLQRYSERGDFVDIIPISAKRGNNLDRLLEVIRQHLPVSPQLFPAESKTDRNMEFRVAEVLREKMLFLIHEEVPYGLAVEILALEHRDDLILIDAIVWVDRESHQGIVVGRNGDRIKKISTLAREDLEEIFKRRFYLKAQVKVKENWGDNARALRQLGYEEGL